MAATRNKKKLLVTTSTFPRWEGDTTPVFIYELSKRLAGEFEVHVLAPFSHGSLPFEKLDGMHLHRYKFFPAKRLFTDGAIVPNLRKNKLFYIQVPFFFIKQILQISRLVRKYKIDTIHAHWIIPQGLAAVIYKKLFNKKIKIAVTSHGTDIFGLTGTLFTKIKKWVLDNANAVTGVSGAVKRAIQDTGIDKGIPVEVIPMGVDMSKFSPDNYDESIKKEHGIKGNFLLFIGRLRELKGIDYLLGAMPKVVYEFPGVKLLIIGEGEEKENLTAFADKIDLLDKNVIFTGAVQNDKLPGYYATADIFIGPSTTEGLGLVFIEAMSCGCPVIASDIPALADIIIDGETGFVVPPKNSVKISEKIIALLKDKPLRDELKEQGRKHVLSRFDWETVAARYAGFLKKM